MEGEGDQRLCNSSASAVTIAGSVGLDAHVILKAHIVIAIIATV